MRLYRFFGKGLDPPMTFPDWTERTDNNQLRVAMVVGGFPSDSEPTRGLFNHRAALSLRDHGVDIIVFQFRVLKPGRKVLESEIYDGIPVIRFALPQLPIGYNTSSARIITANLLLFQHFGWWVLRYWLINCDLIHSVQAFPIGCVCSTWTQSADCRHITQIVGTDLDVGLARHGTIGTIRGWEKYLHGVSCNSRALMRTFKRKYPTVNNVQTIYRGVNSDTFSQRGETAGPLAGGDPVQFCFLGGFPRYAGSPNGANTKGGFTLMKAWQIAEDLLIEAGASLLIGGPQTDIPEIKKWHDRLNAPERVVIVELVPPNEIAAYYRAADVILIPSLQEGLPNVGMEAAACECAIFGSDVGGIPEVVQHNITGLILPPGDAKIWAEALVLGANQLEQLRDMGARGRQHVEQHFDSRNYPLETIKLYQLVVNIQNSRKVETT